MSTKNSKEIVLTQPVNADIWVIAANDGAISLLQGIRHTHIDPVTLPALIEILQSYVEKPKMRYFLVFGVDTMGENVRKTISAETYPSERDVSFSITNIIELSEQDYNSFTK